MPEPMFHDRSDLLHDNFPQLNYGIAVTDVDGDGKHEFFVAGYDGANQVLKWDGSQYIDIADETLADARRQAIGVAAGDLDGDGREEIYILNTDTFSGRKQWADRLLHYHDGQWRDLFGLPANRDALNLTAGRSVACVDRLGNGRYSFFIANYGGAMRCYELDENEFLADMAPYIGLAYVTGGRSLVALPLISERMDVFAGNEGGPNFLFCNRGDGHYSEEAEHYELTDEDENARGIAVLDADDDGRLDLAIGNWDGPHRLYVQADGGAFRDIAPPEMAAPSYVRTVIAADFDNDGYEELFFNNLDEPNRLFGQRNGWVALPIGDAEEPWGLGTGAAVADLDGDGRLELLISHGEAGAQPLTLYHGPANGNHWLRVLPLTRYGAPARGALVTLHAAGRRQIRAIDAGSGYLCQMEPVAHFGLGRADAVERIEIRWPDGVTHTVQNPPIDRLLRVTHPQT
jgi:hypothetical protein